MTPYHDDKPLTRQQAHKTLQKGQSDYRAGNDPGPIDLKLSEGQRRTILQYTQLPAHLTKRLSSQGAEETVTPFTLDELDELLDGFEAAIHHAKGNEKQKVLRILGKVEGLLGSRIDPDDFPKRRRSKQTSTAFQIKMALKGIDAPIWRRIQTRDCTLEKLHAIIQLAMGWDFGHPYCFNIGGVECADVEVIDDEESWDASSTKLSDVLPAQNRRPRFDYTYDFGDEWVHQLIVEERTPPEPEVKYPVCMAGARACPPEDCGGPWGYADFVEACRNPEDTRHEEIVEWMGEGFDPEEFDLEAVNERLQQLR